MHRPLPHGTARRALRPTRALAPAPAPAAAPAGTDQLLLDIADYVIGYEAGPGHSFPCQLNCSQGTSGQPGRKRQLLNVCAGTPVHYSYGQIVRGLVARHYSYEQTVMGWVARALLV
jgi:hypothetical protein